MDAGDEAELELRGPLTLRHAAGIRDRLLTALAQNSRLAVSLKDQGEVDVSFVQILLAARLSARLAGGRLRLTTPPDEGLVRIIALGGFTEMEALWSGGGAT